ncbi:hypothetical protein DFH08DRAFT_5992 [Mycena albidolilacea]|uniref:PARP-type domain-containing protein n=1 Tax=Mycena albidolilacea TaxID=1033008 RepID=A0AAD7AUF1_9AGAR|nr:hypothetical protein DFH08DRAFT_5992 [Mycena albidolilacea]
MSDDERGSKKTGYRLEYAVSGRAKCKGAKPCNGTTIGKGELRLGTLVEVMGKTSFAWRHYYCISKKVFSNMKKIHEDSSEVDGFEDLSEEDQARFSKAFENGEVPDEDIPDSARKPAAGDDDDDDEDGDKPKKKKAAPKKKKTAAEDGDDEPKPKKKAAPKKKKAADDDEEMDDGDEDAKPAKKKAAPKKRTPKKKKVFFLSPNVQRTKLVLRNNQTTRARTSPRKWKM